VLEHCDKGLGQHLLLFPLGTSPEKSAGLWVSQEEDLVEAARDIGGAFGDEQEAFAEGLGIEAHGVLSTPTKVGSSKGKLSLRRVGNLDRDWVNG
jgi:hypothetical protein